MFLSEVCPLVRTSLTSLSLLDSFSHTSAYQELVLGLDAELFRFSAPFGPLLPCFLVDMGVRACVHLPRPEAGAGTGREDLVGPRVPLAPMSPCC